LRIGHALVLSRHCSLILDKLKIATDPYFQQKNLNILLNTEIIKSTYFALPPIQDQYAIVEHIEAEDHRTSSMIAKTQKLIDLLTEYRTALISEVVTGKIKVA
jgi:restriction endonuclease S subunit